MAEGPNRGDAMHRFQPVALEDFTAATRRFDKPKEIQPQMVEHDEADRPARENLSVSADGMGERVTAAMVAKAGWQPDHFDVSEGLSIIRDPDESGCFMGQRGDFGDCQTTVTG